MSQNTIYTRLQLKYDSYTNWTTVNPTLLSGEVAIAKLVNDVTIPVNEQKNAPVLFKVGPGAFNDLPWASALAADVYAWAKQTEEEFTTWVNARIQHPVLSVVDPDVATKKFITKIEVSDHTITVTRSNVDWADVENKPDFDAAYKKLQTAYTAEGSTVKTVTKVEQNANGEVEVTYADIAFPVTDISGKKDKQEKYTAEGSTVKTITKVEQNENGEVAVTYEDITFPTRVANADEADKVKEALTITVGGTDVVFDGSEAKTANVDTAIATGLGRVHTHKVGDGLKQSATGGLDCDVLTELNLDFVDDGTHVKLVDKNDNSKVIAQFATADFVKDSFLENVTYTEADHNLTFTFIDNSDNKQDIVVPLAGLVDVYTFKAGNVIDVETVNGETTISHETVAAPTETAGAGRKYLTGVTTDGYGHITGFTTATEVDQDLTHDHDDDYKAIQTPVSGKELTGAKVLESLTQDAQGVIAYETRDLTPADIGAKAVQTAKEFAGATNKTVTGVTQNENGEVEVTYGDIAFPEAIKASGSALIAEEVDNIVTIHKGAQLSEDHKLSNTEDTAITLAKIAKTGSIYDVLEGANVSTGSGDTGTLYLIFNCGSATTVI